MKNRSFLNKLAGAKGKTLAAAAFAALAAVLLFVVCGDKSDPAGTKTDPCTTADSLITQGCDGYCPPSQENCPGYNPCFADPKAEGCQPQITCANNPNPTYNECPEKYCQNNPTDSKCVTAVPCAEDPNPTYQRCPTEYCVGNQSDSRCQNDDCALNYNPACPGFCDEYPNAEGCSGYCNINPTIKPGCPGYNVCNTLSDPPHNQCPEKYCQNHPTASECSQTTECNVNSPTEDCCWDNMLTPGWTAACACIFNPDAQGCGNNPCEVGTNEECCAYDENNSRCRTYKCTINDTPNCPGYCDRHPNEPQCLALIKDWCYWAPNSSNQFKGGCAEIGSTTCTEANCQSTTGCETGYGTVVKSATPCDGKPTNCDGVNPPATCNTQGGGK